MEQSKCLTGGSSKRIVETDNDSSPSKRRRVDENNVDKSKFPKINDILTKMRVGDKIEFLGLVVKMEEEVSKMTRAGKMTPMRKVLLTDNGEDEIFLTIWGPERTFSRVEEKCVLFVKLATLIEFNNQKLLTTPRSLVTVNPSIPEAHRLKNLPIKTTPVIRDDASVPTTSKNQFFQNRFANYKFVSITEIETKINAGTKIDFIGLVVEVRDQVFCSVSNGESTIREITLTDDTGSEIVAAIYSKDYDDSEILPNFVLFLKTAAVVPWNGEKRLSVIRFNVWVNPTIPEAEELKKLIKTVRVDDEHSNVQTEEKIENPTAACENSYTPIADILENIPEKSVINVLGVVVYRKALGFKMVNGEKSDALKIALLDQTERTIWMQLSGPNAFLLSSMKSDHSIVECLKIMVVIVQGSKRLVCSRYASIFNIEPNNEKARELQRWFKNFQCTSNFEKGLSSTTAAIINENRTENLLNSGVEKEKHGNFPNSIDNEDNRENLSNSVVEGKKYENLSNSVEDKKRENFANSVVEGKKCENLSNSVEDKKHKNLPNSIAEEKRNHSPNSVVNNENDDLIKSLCNVKFTPIIDIHENIPVDSIINIIGAVHTLGPLHIVEYSNGSTSCNRIVTIVDDSQKSIHLRIFNTQARSVEYGVIIAVTNVKVCAKKCLVPSMNDSVCLVNPLFEKAQALKEWYKINAIDKPFAEIMLPITSNADIFDKFNEGDQTSILGILKEIQDLNELQSDTPMSENLVDVWRKIELVDHTEVIIVVILWGDNARNFEFPIGTILLITNVRVSVIQEKRFCCCMGLSNIIAHPTEKKVVDFVNRLQIWSNVRTLRSLYEKPNDVEMVSTVTNTPMNRNNSIGILMGDIRKWYLQVPIKVQPMNCLDSETFDIVDKKKEALIFQRNEEKKIIKTETDESIDHEIFTSLESQIINEEIPCSNRPLMIKEEIDIAETNDDFPYLSCADGTRDVLEKLHSK